MPTRKTKAHRRPQRSRRLVTVSVVAVLLLGGGGFALAKLLSGGGPGPSSTGAAARSPSVSAEVPTLGPTPSGARSPFSLVFFTDPCSGFTGLIDDRWALRDAVTGRVFGRGIAHAETCGFVVRFRLSASDYQASQKVYAFDPKVTIVGLAGVHVGTNPYEVRSGGGPYLLRPGAVVRTVALVNCDVDRTACV